MGRTSDAKVRLMQVVIELIWTGSYGSITIDDICGKAGVKRGSFYYFFDSKADLALTALDDEWERRRPELDAIFSPTVPPLERLKRYCEYGYKIQAEWKAKCGHVLGCVLFALGSEVSTQEAELAKNANLPKVHGFPYFPRMACRVVARTRRQATFARLRAALRRGSLRSPLRCERRLEAAGVEPASRANLPAATTCLVRREFSAVR